MILPDKYVLPGHSLIDLSAVQLKLLRREEGASISRLWDLVRIDSAITFDRFLLALDLLYILRCVRVGQDGLLRFAP